MKINRDYKTLRKFTAVTCTMGIRKASSSNIETELAILFLLVISPNIPT
jgi:hypothetical protein